MRHPRETMFQGQQIFRRFIGAIVATSSFALPAYAESDSQLDWQFSEGVQRQQKSCTVVTGRGKVVVGFTAVQGEEYRGFAVNLIKGETRATWRVDDGLPAVVDGVLTSSGGWLTAEGLQPEFLKEAAKGRELAVTSANSERVIVSLAGASRAITSFEKCRTRPSGSAGAASNLDTAMNAFASGSALQFQCRFRMADVDGIDIPPGTIGGQSYRRQLEIIRAAVTLNLKTGEFIVNGQKVDSAEVKQPSDKLPDGGAVMAFGDFATAIGLAQGAGATRGLSPEQQATFRDVLKQFGSAAKAMNPNRFVLFNASNSGSLFFFDVKNGQSVNQMGVHCD